MVSRIDETASQGQQPVRFPRPDIAGPQPAALGAIAVDHAGKRVVSPTLIGRAKEFELLVGIAANPPAVVVLEGEAGVGKTRLVHEAGHYFQRNPRRLMIGSCRRIREPFPLGPVIEALRGLDDALAAAPLSPVVGALHPLLPELAPLLPPPPAPLDDPVAQRHRVFRALTDLLTALGPSVLVLENLHWADQQTVDFLSYLLGDDLPPDLSVVVTFRGDEVSTDIRALTARPPGGAAREHLVLTPLGEPETAALTAAILGADRVSEELAAYLWRRTSGLPFAIEEMLALLRARGDLVRDPNGRWVRRALDELDVPTSIRDQVWQRVSQLSEPTRAVVEAAAVLQVPVPSAVLLATSRLPARSARRGLEEALLAGILAETPDGTGFRHPLAAQAVYEALSSLCLQELHAEAAKVLADLPEPPLGQVAHHLRQSGEPAAWVDAAERAAEQALGLGHAEEAARLLEDVLRHAPLDSDRRGRLAVRFGEAAHQTLRITTDVTDLLSEVLQENLPTPLRGELSFRLGALLNLAATDFGRQRELFYQAVQDLEHRPELKAHAMVGLGLPALPAVPPHERRQWLHRALEIVTRIGDQPFQTFLLGKIAMVMACMGDPLWHHLADVVVQRTSGKPANRRETIAYLSIAEDACRAGHVEASERLLLVALTAADAAESRELQLRIAGKLVMLDYCRSAWDELAQRASALIDRVADYGVGRLEAEIVADCLALSRGDLAGAEQRLDELIGRAEQAGSYDLIAIPLNAQLRLMVSRGQPRPAAARGQRFLEAIHAVGLYPTAVRALPAVVDALVAARQFARAQEAVVEFDRALRELDAPLAPACLEHAGGFLDVGTGQWRSAAARFAEAADRYQAVHCGYEAAQAREQAALALLRDGTGAAGRAGELLRAALTTYQALGATWDYSRAARAARRYGASVPARHRGGHRGYGEDLSPRERAVAELAASGLSNRVIAGDLFISVNTVKKQLAAAMRKLGARSRTELAGRLGDPDVSYSAVNGPPGP